MSSAASFLSGAGSRLLPASIPFRFFAMAASFHLVFWGLLFFGAADLIDFTGGPSIILAALHALTLGVLSMTAIGAALQLLPVATRQSLGALWPVTLLFWLFSLGTVALVLGMATANDMALHAGASGAGAGLILFAIVTARNLSRAGKLALIAAHGWLAVIACTVVVALGISLIVDFSTGFLSDHQAVAHAHMALAVFGFMGVLATGFSRILIPMFALSPGPSDGLGWGHLGATFLAIMTYLGGEMTGVPRVQYGAVALGLLAAGIYIFQMRTTLKSRMRKRLGLPFLLIISSWGFLLAGLLAGLVALGEGAPDSTSILFGFLVIAGWLLTFLLGVLQRIMPFLASMHASKTGGMPPLLSDLTPAIPLKLTALFHFIAVITCAVGIAVEISSIITIGAIFGIISALSFGVFTLRILRKL